MLNIILKEHQTMSKDLNLLLDHIREVAPSMLDAMNEDEILLSLLDRFSTRELYRALDNYIADWNGEERFDLF